MLLRLHAIALISSDTSYLSPLRFRLFIVAEACDLAYFCKQRVLAGLEEASYSFFNRLP